MSGDWDELRRYVGFDEGDAARLRALWPLVQPEVPAIIDHFYERVLAFDGTRRVLADEGQVERLKCTLATWLEELLRGPYDDAYLTRRQRIGRRHVQVGLEARYMHAAMQVLADDLDRIAIDGLPPSDASATSAAARRVMSLELAIMTSGYVESRERQSLSAIQELLVYHLRVTVLLVDHGGIVTAATRPTTRIFGGAEVVGRPWNEAVPPELLASSQLEGQVERALLTGREISLPRVDVTPEAVGAVVRSFRIHIVPLKHPLAAFLLQVEELTDAVALEGRLRRSEALAQLGALSAAVAHELRNPLAGISGAIQVIGRSIPSDAPYAPIMGKVEGEIRRLDTLVTDLLAFARQGSVRLVPVDLERPVRAAIELVSTDHPEVAFALDGRGRAQADEDLVQQIVLNLLQNAVQALKGPGRIEVALRDGEIVVSDSGPGVPAELAERVFQPFYTTKTRGTGLGLAICQRSAHAMNGRLVLRPPGPLGGAVFALELQPSVEGN